MTNRLQINHSSCGKILWIMVGSTVYKKKGRTLFKKIENQHGLSLKSKSTFIYMYLGKEGLAH